MENSIPGPANGQITLRNVADDTAHHQIDHDDLIVPGGDIGGPAVNHNGEELLGHTDVSSQALIQLQPKGTARMPGTSNQDENMRPPYVPRRNSERPVVRPQDLDRPRLSSVEFQNESQPVLPGIGSFTTIARTMVPFEPTLQLRSVSATLAPLLLGSVPDIAINGHPSVLQPPIGTATGGNPFSAGRQSSTCSRTTGLLPIGFNPEVDQQTAQPAANQVVPTAVQVTIQQATTLPASPIGPSGMTRSQAVDFISRGGLEELDDKAFWLYQKASPLPLRDVTSSNDFFPSDPRLITFVERQHRRNVARKAAWDRERLRPRQDPSSSGDEYLLETSRARHWPHVMAVHCPIWEQEGTEDRFLIIVTAELTLVEAFPQASEMIYFYNPEYFQMYPGSRLVNIKVDHIDCILHAIDSGNWTDQPAINERIMKLWKHQKEAGFRFPIYLLFSVSGTKQYCAVAQMSGPVDLDAKVTKWPKAGCQGVFPLNFIYVKNVPFTLFQDVTNEYNGQSVINMWNGMIFGEEASRMVMERYVKYSHRRNILAFSPFEGPLPHHPSADSDRYIYNRAVGLGKHRHLLRCIKQYQAKGEEDPHGGPLYWRTSLLSPGDSPDHFRAFRQNDPSGGKGKKTAQAVERDALAEICAIVDSQDGSEIARVQEESAAKAAVAHAEELEDVMGKKPKYDGLAGPKTAAPYSTGSPVSKTAARRRKAALLADKLPGRGKKRVSNVAPPPTPVEAIRAPNIATSHGNSATDSITEVNAMRSSIASIGAYGMSHPHYVPSYGMSAIAPFVSYSTASTLNRDSASYGPYEPPQAPATLWKHGQPTPNAEPCRPTANRPYYADCASTGQVIPHNSGPVQTHPYHAADMPTPSSTNNPGATQIRTVKFVRGVMYYDANSMQRIHNNGVYYDGSTTLQNMQYVPGMYDSPARHNLSAVPGPGVPLPRGMLTAQNCNSSVPSVRNFTADLAPLRLGSESVVRGAKTWDTTSIQKFGDGGGPQTHTSLAPRLPVSNAAFENRAFFSEKWPNAPFQSQFPVNSGRAGVIPRAYFQYERHGTANGFGPFIAPSHQVNAYKNLDYYKSKDGVETSNEKHERSVSTVFHAVPETHGNRRASGEVNINSLTRAEKKAYYMMKLEHIDLEDRMAAIEDKAA